MLAGGMRRTEQRFNESGARSQATLLTLAAIALIIPAAYSALVSGLSPGGTQVLSVSISIILLIVYGLFLLFSLWTHSTLFLGASLVEEGLHDPPRSADR